MNKSDGEAIRTVTNVSDLFRKELVQRITRSLLDIQILRLIHIQPMWGYIIKKRVEEKFGVKLRHGALYPLLSILERENFLSSQKQQHGGRIRKVYTITQKGRNYAQAYREIIKEQMEEKDLR
jgi:DNA-binding PadR family transcriptional regulator